MTSRNKLLLALLLFGITAAAQNRPGTFSGSFYSTSHIYYDDLLLSNLAPPDRFASNNYLLLRYDRGPFSAGLQYEAYLPPIIGTAYQYEGSYIPFRFIRYRHEKIDITAGTFYEQFGSGLSFRSFEERALGYNNSLDGVRLIITPASGVRIKALSGRMRRFDEVLETGIRGIDGELDLGRLMGKKYSVAFGAGLISSYNEDTGPFPGAETYTNAVNTRLAIQSGRFGVNGEYVSKADGKPGSAFFKVQGGKAYVLNSSYARSGLGVFLSTRLLKSMDYPANDEFTDGMTAINYLPSNTRQSAYMLPNLYPWATRGEGEFSYQADITWKPGGSKKSGSLRQTVLRPNFSDVRGLTYSVPDESLILQLATKRYYRDFNIEVEKRWGIKLKAKLLYQNIFLNRGALERTVDEIIDSDILIADATWRASRRIALRTELQHLWSNDDRGNWYGVLTEVTMAPGYSIYFSNMSDYQSDDSANYYSFGATYRTGYANISLGYGRNREGYLCSGGICRKIPAYKGISLTVTSSF